MDTQGRGFRYTLRQVILGIAIVSLLTVGFIDFVPILYCGRCGGFGSERYSPEGKYVG